MNRKLFARLSAGILFLAQDVVLEHFVVLTRHAQRRAIAPKKIMLLENLVNSIEGLVEFFLGYDLVAVLIDAGKIQKIQRQGVANLPPLDDNPRLAAIQIVSQGRRGKCGGNRQHGDRPAW